MVVEKNISLYLDRPWLPDIDSVLHSDSNSTTFITSVSPLLDVTKAKYRLGLCHATVCRLDSGVRWLTSYHLRILSSPRVNRDMRHTWSFDGPYGSG